MPLGLNDAPFTDIAQLADTAVHRQGQYARIGDDRTQSGFELAGKKGIEGRIVSRIFMFRLAHVDAEAVDEQLDQASGDATGLGRG